ncbi:MAG: hypothetical protein R6X02_31725 [Enhygromyxa sp.]
MNPNPGHRKGDEHSGGGGKRGGGGKKGRPADGWEKGDVARDVDNEHGDQPLPVKPGRREKKERST